MINQNSAVRPSPIAGRWYPGDISTLAKQVDDFLKMAKVPPLNGRVVGVVAPHAGYIYSGSVAAYAYASIRDLSPEIIVIVSPLHQYAAYPLLTTAHDAYATPFGEVPIAKEYIESLNKILALQLGEQLEKISYDQEHSLEIQLPFLQRIYPQGFHLLPVMVRDATEMITKHLGNALSEVLKDQNVVLVASTDLSHFYPQKYAEELDAEMIRRVKAFDPKGVLQAEEEGVGFACGRGALATVLWAAKGLGANRVEILRYSTSGDVSGDYSQVVGYMAAAILKTS